MVVALEEVKPRREFKRSDISPRPIFHAQTAMMNRLVSLWCLLSMVSTTTAEESIDRRDLVQRHRPMLREVDPLTPLSVGNGEFAFTVDITGLQTFPDEYTQGIPLSTQSQWGWHSFANPKQYRLEDALVEYDAHGRKTVYASNQKSDAGQWLRANPHRLGLARIGFELIRDDGGKGEVDDVRAIEQTLDLWSGTLVSRFEFDGETVHVRTSCHPRLDLLAVEVESPLLRRNQLKVAFQFAYGTGTGPYRSPSGGAIVWDSRGTQIGTTSSDIWLRCRVPTVCIKRPKVCG